MSNRITIGAILPMPEPWRRLFATIRTDLGDPLGDIIAPHVTILAATLIEASELPNVVRFIKATATRFAPFRIELDGVQTFLPITDVVYSPLASGVEECTALAEAIRAGPLTAEVTYPYHPHLTLAQGQGRRALKRARDLLEGFRVGFPATELVLSTSTGSIAEWTPIARIPLAAPRSRSHLRLETACLTTS